MHSLPLQNSVLIFAIVVEVSEGINDGRDRPGLRRARVMTGLPVGVGQLGQALPPVLDDVLLVGEQPLHGLMHGLVLGFVVHEDELGLQEEAYGPDPLRTLMVVEAMRVVRVDIITVVLSIFWIEGLDTHTALLHQDIGDIDQACLSIGTIEELWGIAHGDADVWPQLVVCVDVTGSIHILVDASSIDHLRYDIVMPVLVFIRWDPEAPLEVISHLFSPVGETYLHVSTTPLNSHSSLSNCAILVQTTEPAQNRVLHRDQLDGCTISRGSGHSFVFPKS